MATGVNSNFTFPENQRERNEKNMYHRGLPMCLLQCKSSDYNSSTSRYISSLFITLSLNVIGTRTPLHYGIQTFIFLSDVCIRSGAVSDSTDGRIITAHSTHSKHDTVRTGKADSRTLQGRRGHNDVRYCAGSTGVARGDVTDIAPLALSAYG